jgi:hypothetical protein
MAAVLAGWGGPTLLDSYEIERKPIATQTIELAALNMSKLSSNFADPLLSVDGPEGDACRAEVAAAIQATKHAEFHSLGLVLGYHYGRSPLTLPDGSAEPDIQTSTYTPSARPGSLLPHFWLPDGRSVYDVLGRDFTLLILDPNCDHGELLGAAVRLVPRQQLIGGCDPAYIWSVLEDAVRRSPLAVVNLVDLGCDPAELATLYDASMLLVRPDQHVAWRTHLHSLDEAAAQHVLDIASAAGPRPPAVIAPGGNQRGGKAVQ